MKSKNRTFNLIAVVCQITVLFNMKLVGVAKAQQTPPDYSLFTEFIGLVPKPIPGTVSIFDNSANMRYGLGTDSCAPCSGTELGINQHYGFDLVTGTGTIINDHTNPFNSGYDDKATTQYLLDDSPKGRLIELAVPFVEDTNYEIENTVGIKGIEVHRLLNETNFELPKSKSGLGRRSWVELDIE